MGRFEKSALAVVALGCLVLVAVFVRPVLEIQKARKVSGQVHAFAASPLPSSPAFVGKCENPVSLVYSAPMNSFQCMAVIQGFLGNASQISIGPDVYCLNQEAELPMSDMVQSCQQDAEQRVVLLR